MTSHTINITMGDNTLTVDCYYTHHKGSTDYPESHEVEIERICIGQEDVTELIAGMYVKVAGGYYDDAWNVIEQKCLEEIYERRAYEN